MRQTEDATSSAALAACRRFLESRRDDIAERWHQALARVSFVPQSADEMHRQLLGLTDRVCQCLLGEPFQRSAAPGIGAALVALRCSQPEALEQTQLVLAEALVDGLEPDHRSLLRPRLAALLAGIALGFVRQVQATMLNEQEAIRGVLMSQRRQAEEALTHQFAAAERARGQLGAVLDAARDGMLLISPDRVALTVNSRFEELMAMPAETVLGRKLVDLEPHLSKVFGDLSALLKLLEQVSGTEAEGTQDFTQYWPQQRVLQLHSTPVHGADRQLIGRLHALRDVTGDREVDRMKSEFVSLVSHELRTPLTSIKGYADLLLAGEVGELTADQQEFLTIVKNNSDRLVDLVSDLLDLSRIEAGHVELRSGTLDLATIINSVVRSFRPQVQRKRQRVTLDLAAHLPAINGDSDRVTQILTNLVSNAHKYTPPGGRVAITAQPAGDSIRIDVRDTGIGIAEEDYPRLFTKFYRSNNRAAREIGGTGLGLAITRSLVEMHGGTITVSSVLGQGSTFSVLLPAALEPAPLPAAPPPAQPHRQILVVDDEQDIAKLLQRYLQHAGYEVELAHDAMTGFHLARNARPDLITLDVLMEGTDGFTALEWLKADPSTSSIPVMLISILEDSGRGKLLGAVDYLTKPIQEQFFLEHVATILAGRDSYLVLVADDDPDVRQLLTYLLRQRGYRVITAADGAEAIALAQREHPDLALLDVRMPGTDGLAALAALQADPSTREVPVIMLTASPDVAAASWPVAERLGAARLIRTPCTAEELATAIAELLRTGHGP